MRIGDVLEWLAGAAAVTATYLGSHQLWAAFAGGAVVLAYQAQCYGAAQFSWPKIKLPRLRRSPK